MFALFYDDFDQHFNNISWISFLHSIIIYYIIENEKCGGICSIFK